MRCAAIFIAVLALTAQIRGDGELTMNDGTMTLHAKDFEFYTPASTSPMTTMSVLVSTVSALQSKVGALQTFQSNVLSGNCPTGQYVKSFSSAGVPACAMIDNTQWQARVTGTCPTGQHATGVNQDGTVTCTADVFATTTCTGSQVVSGFNSDGSPVCVDASPDATLWQARISNTCPTGQHATGVSQAGVLSCSKDGFAASFTCPTGQVVSSFGSDGTPSCVDPAPDATLWQARISNACPSGQHATGVSQAGVLSCSKDGFAASFTCPTGQVVSSFGSDGTPSCVTPTPDATQWQQRVGAGCSTGKFVSGVNQDGSLNCLKDNYPTTTCTGSQVVSGFSSAGVPVCVDATPDASVWQMKLTKNCASDEALSGFAADGTPVCASMPDISNLQDRVTGTCPAGQSMQTIKANGDVTCHADVDTNIKATACPAGQVVTGFDSAGAIQCVADSDTGPDPTQWQSRISNTCPTGQHATGVSQAGVLSCSKDSFAASFTCPAGQVVNSFGVDGTPTCVADSDTSPDPTQWQARITTSCAAGEFVQSVGQDGKPVCAAALDSDTCGNTLINSAAGKSVLINGENLNSMVSSLNIQIPFGEQAKLMHAVPTAYDYFGRAVDTDSIYSVIGAYADDTRGSSSGSSYVFIKKGVEWSQEQELTASDGSTSDYFGYDVGISGTSIIVGAYLNDDSGSSSGSAYIFLRTGTSTNTPWAQQAKLLASDAASGDNFGFAVDISGDMAIVGAHNNDDTGTSAGSAYLFKRTGTTWNTGVKIVASDATASDYFGYAVGISGSTAVVGAYLNDDTGTDSGSAYIFQSSNNGATWDAGTKVVASDAASGDYYGRAVAIDGDTIVIGAYYGDDKGTNSGAAYVLTKSCTGQWSETAKLSHSDGISYDYFGFSVDVDGDRIIVGAYSSEDTTPPAGTLIAYSSGSAYIFQNMNGQWIETDRLSHSDAEGSDYFGYAVSISGASALVGAYQSEESITAYSTGSAYVFAAGATDPSKFQTRVMGACEEGYFMTSINIDGSATCEPRLPTDACGNTVVPAAEGKVVLIDNIDVAQSLRKVDTSLPSGGTSGGSTPAFPSVRVGDKVLGTAANNYLGYTASVGISGNTLIGGEYRSTVGTFTNAGTASIWVMSGSGATATWTKQATLQSDVPKATDYFGWGTAIDGDYAVIGAYQDDTAKTGSGAVYLFKRTNTNWAMVGPRLTMPITQVGTIKANFYDYLGRCVAISGNTFVAGAYAADTYSSTGAQTASSTGAILVWTVTGTTVTLQGALGPADTTIASQYAGWSVDISGDTIVSGGYIADPNGISNAGAAWVYQRTGTTWAVLTTLTASDAAANDYFGYDVAVSGSTIVVGAYNDGDKGTSSGSAYVYDLATSGPCSAGSSETKITVPTGRAYDYFGRSVDISGNVVIGGAYGTDYIGTSVFSSSGSAYVFTRTAAGEAFVLSATLNNYRSLTTDTTLVSDYFGFAVALDKTATTNPMCAVGAYLDDANGITSSGSINVFGKA